MIAQLHRLVAVLLIASLAAPFPAQAALIATDSALQSAQHERVASLLERADVRAQLQAYGVSAADVKARVAALTDDEAAELANRIDTLPAGGSIVGAIVLVFLVLLLTDILGFTKVFPFTRSIR